MSVLEESQPKETQKTLLVCERLLDLQTAIEHGVAGYEEWNKRVDIFSGGV